MKMQRFQVEFTSTHNVTVYAPEGTGHTEILAIANGIAKNPSAKGWEMPEYEAFVQEWQPIDLPADDRQRLPPNRHGHRAVAGGLLAAEDAVVLSDDEDDLVNPTDATWWEAP